MRRLFCTFSALAATGALWACSTLPSTPASSSPPGGASASAAPAATSAAPAPTAGGKKPIRTAAECPSVGDPVAAAGPPSSGKARHDEIVATFQKHRDKFRCCYDAARQQTPALKGAYVVEIVLQPDGTLKSVLPKKDASEIRDQGMDDCVYTVAKTLKFSPHADGKESTIPYPFGFSPDSGGKMEGSRLALRGRG